MMILGWIYIALGVFGIVVGTDFPDYIVDGATIAGIGIALISIRAARP